MIIYLWSAAGCLVLRASADLDIQAWFDSRIQSGTFQTLGIMRVEWEHK